MIAAAVSHHHHFPRQVVSARDAAPNFVFNIDIPVPPGSQTMGILRKALAAPAKEDSNITFFLKSVGPQVRFQRLCPSPFLKLTSAHSARALNFLAFTGSKSFAHALDIRE